MTKKIFRKIVFVLNKFVEYITNNIYTINFETQSNNKTIIKHEKISFLIGGDIVIDNTIKATKNVYTVYDTITPKWKKIFFKNYLNMPLYNVSKYKKVINEYDSYSLKFNKIISNPFKNLLKIMNQHALCLVNLESPIRIEDNNKPKGMFLSDKKLIEWMLEANIKAVSIANNHSFDDGEIGFKRTLELLDNARIQYFGGGYNLNEIFHSQILNIDNVKIGVIAMTQKCNTGFNVSAITDFQAGVLPLDLYLMKDLVDELKKNVSMIIFYPHWSISESSRNIEKTMKQVAHLSIDFGVDLVVGHGPHVVQEYEEYREKPIFYSLGNFVFGHNQKVWDDNILLSIEIENSNINTIKIIPISGKNESILAPTIIKDEYSISKLRNYLFRQKPFLNIKIYGEENENINNNNS